MFRSIALAAVLSSAMIATGSGTAHAGFHHRAKASAGYCYPAYAACAPCMVIAGGCGTRDCYGGYTIAPCQAAPARHGCCLHHWAKVAATRFAGCLDGCGCDGGCGSGCGDGSCGGGCGDGACGGGCSDGCAGCANGGGASCSGCSGGQPSGGDVNYDGPAAADQPAPPPIPNSEASVRGNSQYRLVSQSAAGGGNGAAAFDQGLALFRARSFTNALQSFEAAATAEPNNAIYQYYRALTLFDLNGAEAGREALQQAIELEKREAVPHWGKRMERVQGRGRVWIEKARREAGLVK